MEGLNNPLYEKKEDLLFRTSPPGWSKILVAEEALEWNKNIEMLENDDSYFGEFICKDLARGACGLTNCMDCGNMQVILAKADYVNKLCNFDDNNIIICPYSEHLHKYCCKEYRTKNCQYSNCMCCPIMHEILQKAKLYEDIRQQRGDYEDIDEDIKKIGIERFSK